LREQRGGRLSKFLIGTNEAAHHANPFLNFTWDNKKIELTHSRDQIIPSPLGMRSYETFDLMLPTLGIDLFTNHDSISMLSQPCFFGTRVAVYKKVMHLHRHLLLIQASFSHDYNNTHQHDRTNKLAFGEYTRTNAAQQFFKLVIGFQRNSVADWNPFRDDITLLYNMEFVGVREDSSDGAASVTLDMLLKFGVLVYNQDETWSLHYFAKLRWLYCFGNRKTIENSSAFVIKLSIHNLTFKESSLQADIFLNAFNKVVFLPVDLAHRHEYAPVCFQAV
jgi:hypothetical protein